MEASVGCRELTLGATNKPSCKALTSLVDGMCYGGLFCIRAFLYRLKAENISPGFAAAAETEPCFWPVKVRSFCSWSVMQLNRFKLKARNILLWLLGFYSIKLKSVKCTSTKHNEHPGYLQACERQNGKIWFIISADWSIKVSKTKMLQAHASYVSVASCQSAVVLVVPTERQL